MCMKAFHFVGAVFEILMKRMHAWPAVEIPEEALSVLVFSRSASTARVVTPSISEAHIE